jgi:ribosomal protein S18 acetylase RimI-like enzyme
METDILITKYNPEYGSQVVEILDSVGWTAGQIEGQIEAIKNFTNHNNNWIVYVALHENSVVGYIIAEFTHWNSMSHIPALVVRSDKRRLKVASRLIAAAEEYMHQKGTRAVYINTRADNADAKAFFESQGYTYDYKMSDYYSEGIDGVTYLKKFSTT